MRIITSWLRINRSFNAVVGITVLFVALFAFGRAPSKSAAPKIMAVSLPKIALVAADTASWVTEVQSKLVATGRFSQVDIIDASSTTPTLAQLLGYKSVLVWNDLGFSDSTTLGNNLADYVDAGGGVVIAVFTDASEPLFGRFASDDYYALEPLSQTDGPVLTLGTVYEPGSPLMSGVNSFDGGSSSFRGTGSLNANAVRVADWSNGDPLIVRRTINGNRRVDLNFFPPSTDSRNDFWVASTDGTTIMANALEFVVPVCVTPPANMISWWKGDGNLLDVQDGNTLSANGDGFGYADGKVSQAFSFNGTTFLSAGNPANLNITGNQVTIDGWVNPSMDMSNEAIFFGKSADGALQYFLEWTSGVLAGRVNNGDTEATFTPPTGVWTHLAMVYNGSSEASVTIYANGAALASTIPSPASGNIISTAAPFTIGGRSDGRNFAGLIDEVEVFNRALDATEVAALYNAGSAGKCVPPLQLTAAASRKHHQDASVPIDAGTFDVNLPLTGGPGVECRAGPVGGEHKVVFTFTNVLMSVDSVSASATSPTGPQPVSSSGSIGADTHEYIVDLSGVPNAQYVTVTLNGAHDNFGQIDAAASATMGVLLGDTTANGAVNSSDIAQTQSQSGQPVTVDNFREDVTVNGLIDSSDIALVQSMSGTALPTPP
jgi:hypothetical protein